MIGIGNKSTQRSPMSFQRSTSSSTTWSSAVALGGPQPDVGGSPVEPLGHQARRLFDRYIRHRRREPDLQFLYLPGVPQLLEIGRWLYWWGLTAGKIQREHGISRWQQLRESCHFTWHEKIQAQLYYMYELYLPEEQARAGGYLTRRETKNGLIR